MDTLSTYYEKIFSTSENGNIYPPLGLMDGLAHARRMALLAALELPDLSVSTVVDYGVGAWGFGCIYPTLKDCKKAIGLDISAAAIALSEQKSSVDPALRGKIVEYHTANGYNLPLDSDSVDVFFAGECIEHIEDTDTYLGEVKRVLKYGGVAIFTTPNAHPWMYRQFGLKWCMGFEHVALMSATDFIRHLSHYFHIEVTKGFNQSFHPRIDAVIDEETAKAWVSACENDIESATSMIALVRKLDNKVSRKSVIVVTEIDQVIAHKEFQDLELSSGFKGRMVVPGSTLEVRVPHGATRCNLIFWSHAWSGVARIEAGDRVEIVDLYSHVGGCWRVQVAVTSLKTVTIEPSTTKRDQSEGYQVILFRAVFAIET